MLTQNKTVAEILQNNPSTVFHVLQSSGLFESSSKIMTALKNKAIKINGFQVEDLKEPIEIGDFINFCFAQDGFSQPAIELVQKHGRKLISVSGGNKWTSKAIVKLEDDGSFSKLA